MNTLELEAYKAELAREVLNTNDPDVLDTIKDIMRKSGNNENPCRMSIKEAQKQLQLNVKLAKSFNTEKRSSVFLLL